MSNCDWLTRIVTTAASSVALGCRVLLVVVAFLLADFVLAYPVCAKDEPKYVGDFPDIAKFPLKKLNFPRK